MLRFMHQCRLSSQWKRCIASIQRYISRTEIKVGPCMSHRHLYMQATETSFRRFWG